MTRAYWIIPRLWPGETAVILAGGPSLGLKEIRHVARAKLENSCRVIAVNDAIYPAWWADWLHSSDNKWWNWHRLTATKFSGIKTTQGEIVPPQWGVELLHNTGIEGFDPDPACVRAGNSSAYQAVHCAIHAGARKIVLLGVDMTEGHWFGRHPDGMDQGCAAMLPCWPTLLPALEERGIEVINCSPDTRLDCFEKRRLAEVL
ncbi:MAG TPA: hypothetical protein VMW31_04620 [Devosiaceae bacterium]|nr:hypothetical protein [Devosiaceae bacterium]